MSFHSVTLRHRALAIYCGRGFAYRARGGFLHCFADPLLETGRALLAHRDDTFSCLSSYGDQVLPGSTVVVPGTAI